MRVSCDGQQARDPIRGVVAAFGANFVEQPNRSLWADPLSGLYIFLLVAVSVPVHLSLRHRRKAV